VAGKLIWPGEVGGKLILSETLLTLPIRIGVSTSAAPLPALHLNKFVHFHINDFQYLLLLGVLGPPSPFSIVLGDNSDIFLFN